MAYTDDAVRAKLSALNETQESIVTTAQWVMFHRRHADHTAQLWVQRLKDSGSNKRLNLIYLANDIVQQSRARRKEDFPTAFSPIIAEATAVAYRGATNEVQQKLRRVVEVWRQRQIFDPNIQLAVESRINDIDKSKGTKRPLLGGSIFASGPASTPAEIAPLVPLQTSLNKASSTAFTSLESANAEYEKLSDANVTGVSPPRQSAQLGGLLKSLATAEHAVSESIKARKELLESLEKLVAVNRTSLAKDEEHQKELAVRKTSIDTRKQHIETILLREMSESGPGSTNGSPGDGSQVGLSPEPDAPEVEPLSPAVEALTPEGSPPPDSQMLSNADPSASMRAEHSKPETNPFVTPGSDLLSSLAVPNSQISPVNASNGFGAKKRKFNDEEDFAANFAAGGAMDGLDDDVAEMLK